MASHEHAALRRMQRPGGMRLIRPIQMELWRLLRTCRASMHCKGCAAAARFPAHSRSPRARSLAAASTSGCATPNAVTIMEAVANAARAACRSVAYARGT